MLDFGTDSYPLPLCSRTLTFSDSVIVLVTFSWLLGAGNWGPAETWGSRDEGAALSGRSPASVLQYGCWGGSAPRGRARCEGAERGQGLRGS